MIIIDKRFQSSVIDLLNTLISKKLSFYKCNPFNYSNSVYGLVGFSIENQFFKLTNYVQELDYYGSNEDVAILKFDACKESDTLIESSNIEMMISSVEQTIKDIIVVNDNQYVNNGIEEYDVYFTRGIVFILENGREISFEKSVWFSEDIIVNTGHNLIEKFAPVSEFAEEFDSDCSFSYNREIQHIK